MFKKIIIICLLNSVYGFASESSVSSCELVLRDAIHKSYSARNASFSWGASQCLVGSYCLRSAMKNDTEYGRVCEVFVGGFLLAYSFYNIVCCFSRQLEIDTASDELLKIREQLYSLEGSAASSFFSEQEKLSNQVSS